MNRAPARVAAALAALAAAFALVALSACLQTAQNWGKAEPDPSWQSIEVEAPTERILWEMTRLSLVKLGYPIGTGFDPTALVVSSGWRNQLSPFSGEGFRIQAQVKVEPTGDRRWKLDVRVRRQVNKSLVRPTDASYAEWSWVPDDVDRARLILQQVRASLGTELEVLDAPKDPFDKPYRPDDDH